MPSARRRHLDGVQAGHATHPGLWLDRFLPSHDTDEAKRQHHVDACRVPEPVLYAESFARWEQLLAAFGAETRLGRVDGRMVVGLGNESVLETSITLHRTYGVPFIPGSALKGLAASYARQALGPEWSSPSEAYRLLFGDTTSAGHVVFHDALYVPGSGHAATGGDGRPRALYPDVVTVHHPDYYQTGRTPPADWDSPTMIHLLSATGTYLLALSGPPDWRQAAFGVLDLALAELGVGAKTSSGYGRLAFVQPGADEPSVQAMLAEIANLPIGQVAPRVPGIAARWSSLEATPAGRRLVAQAIVDKVAQAGRYERSRDTTWYREIVAFLEGA